MYREALYGPSPRQREGMPSVLCVHPFGSNAGQYQGLAQRLAPHFRVLAADLYGHGKSAPWPHQHRFTLADEAAPLEALLPQAAPAHLIGHSYGGAVALRIAAAHRARVRSIVLYEPALWGTLSQLCPNEPATREIEAVRDDTTHLIARGQFDAAAERFIDYWNGAGAWAAIPQTKRPRLVATMRSLPLAWTALFDERWTVDALRALDVPCLLLTGARSTAAARRAVTLLRDVLPDATVIEFDGLGHMGPIARPDRIDASIEDFLLAQACTAEAM
jgi:pimeloyl-ACP methyl ester carboxylesterase